MMIVGFPAVADTTPAGFTLQVLLPGVAVSIPSISTSWDGMWSGWVSRAEYAE